MSKCTGTIKGYYLFGGSLLQHYAQGNYKGILLCSGIIVFLRIREL